jgi:hypothetical protein
MGLAKSGMFKSGLGSIRRGDGGMAKSDPKKEPELHPDTWARFERAVDVVAMSPPQHRVKSGK